MISDAHARAKEAGLGAVKDGLEYVKVKFLGMEAKQPSPVPSRNVSYSTYLYDRFAMPAARQGLASAGTTDIFNLIGKALQQTTYPDSTSKEAQAADLSASGTLIPPSLSAEERTDFITTQRERLQTLLRAFDNEAYNSPTYADQATAARSSGRSPAPQQPSSRKSYLAPAGDASYMHKSRSESEFEDLAYEQMPDPEQYMPRAGGSSQQPAKGVAAGSSGWSNWIWGSYGGR